MTSENENLESRKLKNGIFDGAFGQAMSTLSSGVILVSLALSLGASNFIIGLLAAIPPLMSFMQLPAVHLIERLRNRKRIAVRWGYASRAMLLLILFVPLVAFKMPLIIAMLILHTGIGSVGACAWNSWMKDLVPDSELGRFFSTRMIAVTITSLVLGLLAGAFVTYSNIEEVTKYVWLFVIATMLGFIGMIFLQRLPDRPMEDAKPMRLRDTLRTPFKDVNFRKLLRYTASLQATINLASPFFTVYLLGILGYPLFTVIIFQIFSQFVHIIFLRVWSRFADTHSYKSILRISTPIFILSLFLWTFTTFPDPHFLTLPLLILIHLIMGISLSGFQLASQNIALRLAPKVQSTSYLASHSLIASLTAGVAPLVGGALADFFALSQLSVKVDWVSPISAVSFYTLDLHYWDFFFIFAALIGLYSLHRLSMVEEGKSTRKREITQHFIQTIQTEMRELSTAFGLRTMIRFPIIIANKIRKNTKK